MKMRFAWKVIMHSERYSKGRIRAALRRIRRANGDFRPENM